jgi:hypothetical protein
MPAVEKLHSLLFAATCVREVIDATDPEAIRDLNHLARVHLGITDFMDTLKKREGLS